MTGGIFGGGVIFVVAALLWAAVLVPSWVRRREFRGAERNAVRLQRTLRVLAETAELPEEVRVEATARQAVAHERLLRTARMRQEAELQAELAAAQAERVRAELQAEQARRRRDAMHRAAKLRRPLVRRMRALSALVLLLAFAGLLVGGGIALAGQGAAVLVCSAAAGAAALGGLVLLAPGRVKVAEVPAERVVAAVVEAAPALPHVQDQELANTAAAEAHAAAQAAAAARIERARALSRTRAERPATRTNQPDSMLLAEARAQVEAARAGQLPSAAATVRPASARPTLERPAPERPAASAQTSVSTQASRSSAPAARAPARTVPSPAAADRLRRMGVIGDTSEGMPDLDAVLRRRRAG